MVAVPEWLSRRARTRGWPLATLAVTVGVTFLVVPVVGIAVAVLGGLFLVALWRPDPPQGNGRVSPDLRRADDTRPGKDVRDTSFGHIIGLPPSGGA